MSTFKLPPNIMITTILTIISDHHHSMRVTHLRSGALVVVNWGNWGE